MTRTKDTCTAVLVLGMHRSGTSALTGVLGRFGVDLGPRLGSALPDNPTGFFEHLDVVALHDDLLAQLGSSWDDPAALPDGWERDPRIEPFRDRLRAIIERDFQASRLWGVKDPRLCRFVPLWLDVLAELEIDVKAVLIARDPNAVAASLGKRNGMDPEQSALLWLSHVLASEAASRSVRRTILLYDDLLLDWQHEIQRLRDDLSLDLFAFSADIVDGVGSFLDPDLRHHDAAGGPPHRAPQSAAARTVYESLVRWRRENVSAVEVCTRAAADVAYADRASSPIVRYVRQRARREDDARRKAASDAAVEIRRLEILLDIEARAHSEAAQAAAESMVRETALRAELERLTAARAVMESELRAATATALDGQLRAEAYAEVEIRLRADALAAAVASSANCERQIAELHGVLRDIQDSHSWRLTRPVRVAMLAVRRTLRELRRRTRRPLAPLV